MNELLGESLLATLHVSPFLRREHPFVTKALHAQAQRLPKLMRQEIRAFLDGTPATKPGKPPEFDYLRTLSEVSRPVQPQDLEDMIDSHQEPTDGLDVLFPLTRALAYLSGAAPRRAKTTLTGTIQLVPSDQEIERFRRAFFVVDDPLSALRKLRALALMADEVAALTTVYPALYQLLGDIAREEVAAAKERKGQKWNLTPDRERQLMLLLQMSPSDPGLVKDMQATFGDDQPSDQAEAKPKPKASVDLKGGSFATGAQASEGGGR